MKKLTKPKIVINRSRVIGDDLLAFDHNAVLYEYTVDGVKVVGLHWSGRFDGKAEDLAAHLVYLAMHYNVDYITTTESQQVGVLWEIRNAFTEVGFDWGFLKIEEYALLFDKGVFAFMPKRKPRLQTFTKTFGIPDWKQMKGAWFNLHHRKANRQFQILDIHGPAGIESGAGFKRGPQTETASKGWPRVGRTVRARARTKWWVVRILVSDTNGNHFMEFWRSWFAQQLRMTGVWHKDHLPKQGTHHGRLIDAVYILGAKWRKS